MYGKRAWWRHVASPNVFMWSLHARPSRACACAVVIGQPQGRAASREHVRACAMVSAHNREKTLHSDERPPASWGRETTNKPVKTTAPLCLLYFIDQRGRPGPMPCSSCSFSRHLCLIRYIHQVRTHAWWDICTYTCQLARERTIEICTRCSSTLQLDGD